MTVMPCCWTREGVEVLPTTLSVITDKVWGLVEEWQNRSLASIYPIIYLDAIHIKLRREGKVETMAVYTVLGVDGEGHRDVSFSLRLV